MNTNCPIERDATCGCGVPGNERGVLSMGKIVDLKAYQARAVEQRGFGPWRKRFGESYGLETRLPDLTDRTVYLLALPGEDSTAAFYELIMGLLDLGPAAKFTYLDPEPQLRVVDIHLFLADQVRFEMMRRLDWLGALVLQDRPIAGMVRSFDRDRTLSRQHPPRLSASHPDYEAYHKLHERDRESHVRRLLPAALDAFGRRVSA